MKLGSALENYYTMSGTLSNVNRQLCFAGVAVIWVFTVSDKAGSYSLPSPLLLPLGLFVLGLAFDLLHYAVASATWAIFHRVMEKQGNALDDEVGAPAWLNLFPNIFFWAKVIATGIGYVLLLVAFVR